MKKTIVQTLSRRRILGGLAGAGVGSLFFHPEAIAAQDASSVVIFVALRGGLDGLNAVIPVDEPRYYDLRPHIAVPPPGGLGSFKGPRALALESGFGLHPSLAALLPAFQAKELAIVHAAGLRGINRSHFDAQDAMDRGYVGDEVLSGWMGRLATLLRGDDSLFANVSVGKKLSATLRGAPSPVAIESLETFDVVAGKLPLVLQSVLENNYSHAAGPAAQPGRRALEVVRRLREIRQQVPSQADKYPSRFRGLSELARLIRADVGLKLATVDFFGWDTHAHQGTTAGPLARDLGQLAGGLAAFREELGEQGERVVVVAATEFGRTVAQNGTRGTDHGRGSIALVMGGAVRGGKVYGNFPGLEDAQLEDGRDLAVTTDLRVVFREASEHAMGRVLSAAEAKKLFPNFSQTETLGLCEKPT